MVTSAAEPAKGSTITNNGNGFPITRGQGDLWFRVGWRDGKTWDEVMAWHQKAIDDPDDDTAEPFAPVLMIPAGRASLHLAATREALAKILEDAEANVFQPIGVDNILDALLAPGGPIQLVSDVEAEARGDERRRADQRWVRSIESQREFLQQVADSHNIRTDEVTVAFLADRAAAIRSTDQVRALR